MTYRLIGRHFIAVIVGVRKELAQAGRREFYGWTGEIRLGSRVKSSLACPTPRKAKRPTPTRFSRAAAGRASANEDEISPGRSTAPHLDAMRPDPLAGGHTT